VKKVLRDVANIVRREQRIVPGSIDGGLLLELIAKHNPVILDIGCNDGAHTQWFLDLFPRSHVYSFEPDPRARRRFLADVNSDRVDLFDAAISDRDGTASFYVSTGAPPSSSEWSQELPEGWDLSGSLRRPKQHLKVFPWIKFEGTIEVNTIKLDSWIARESIEVIDLIWADVQGAELDVVKGGEAALNKTRYFYTEYSNRELYEGQVTLRRLLKALPAFEVVCRYESDVLLRNKRFEGE
jgi:FkbM family methyltransferase